MTESVAARRVFAVVPAAGRGERFDAASAGNAAAGRSLPKQYASLMGATVLEWSLRSLLGEPRILGIVVVLGAGDAHGADLIASLNDERLRAAIGGASRQESVMNGLEALDNRAAADDWVLVHDAARPCLSSGDVRALIDALNGGGCGCGAVLAAPIFDTVKRERGGVVSETLDRIGLWRALTPQAFGFAQLKAALGDAIRSGLTVTDEAQAMERMGNRPWLVKGSPFNIKVTHAEDLAAAAGILQFGETNVMPRKIRIGQGFDVHAFGDGEHVVLGGVR
ncbi:MAG TPA: 2-C-methyl-D-erythritol 4-phosphate cytidylyltransferase, partial [Steroidobacteraceae bacterium]|nr:2-C-methyl-D-erythritol 4-phosphate cytidylyltransferase [Steroidobacteraceae bacterium]